MRQSDASPERDSELLNSALRQRCSAKSCSWDPVSHIMVYGSRCPLDLCKGDSEEQPRAPSPSLSAYPSFYDTQVVCARDAASHDPVEPPGALLASALPTCC
jgi:hypothetical protein